MVCKAVLHISGRSTCPIITRCHHRALCIGLRLRTLHTSEMNKLLSRCDWIIVTWLCPVKCSPVLVRHSKKGRFDEARLEGQGRRTYVNESVNSRDTIRELPDDYENSHWPRQAGSLIWPLQEVAASPFSAGRSRALDLGDRVDVRHVKRHSARELVRPSIVSARYISARHPTKHETTARCSSHT